MTEGYGRRVGERLRVETHALCDAHIAVAFGFTAPGHFTRTFSRIVGVSPRAGRQALKE
ncbi:hypothetical protein [Bradyrhizobium sp. th.b2]|uniref:hypothetical protein n=1 Tax=Bradyrhizobium sp. th-b2 TaxID=172088 RepID=UPI0012EB592A|nr:hypothetical protein [Bradyrhizobium sp. th.b2]